MTPLQQVVKIIVAIGAVPSKNSSTGYLIIGNFIFQSRSRRWNRAASTYQREKKKWKSMRVSRFKTLFKQTYGQDSRGPCFELGAYMYI